MRKPKVVYEKVNQHVNDALSICRITRQCVSKGDEYNIEFALIDYVYSRNTHIAKRFSTIIDQNLKHET